MDTTEHSVPMSAALPAMNGVDRKGRANGAAAAAMTISWWSVAVLALLLAIVFPLALDPFRLGLMAKYLCLSFAAVGIVLIWGYGGILSLGQGMFFGLGSYAVAMFLKLEAASVAGSASALSQFYGSSLPDFMVWNSIEVLPWWWAPFAHLGFALAMVVVLPAAVAFALAYANFRKRVGGVYFSIVTLALAAIMAIVIIGQQGTTGGINGITDFRTFAGLPLDGDGPRRVLYFITVALLLCGVVVARWIVASRLGRVLVAIRDREDRVRFSGYDPALFKAFIFAVAAVITAIGGALFALQEGLASPSLVGIVPSVEMVVYAAVGGRLSPVGAVYGALTVLAAKTFFSENFLEYWQYFIGALFIGVVMSLPSGLAGLFERLVQSLRRKSP
ncbi:MAG: urea ABC transporter permease subunit UrtC [Variovorax sp.]